MDGIKVREVSGDEQKSSQQIEQELLAKHEGNVDDGVEKVTLNEPTDTNQEEPQEEKVEVEEPKLEETQNELGDNEVLSYIKNRYDKETAKSEECTI